MKQSWEAPATDPRMLVAVYLIVIQLMLVIAIALFFSTFAEPLWARCSRWPCTSPGTSAPT